MTISFTINLLGVFGCPLACCPSFEKWKKKKKNRNQGDWQICSLIKAYFTRDQLVWGVATPMLISYSDYPVGTRLCVHHTIFHLVWHFFSFFSHYSSGRRFGGCIVNYGELRSTGCGKRMSRSREAMELSGRKFINTDDRFRFTLSSIAAALWPERNEMSSPVDAVAGNKLW